jgi:hypothetical protein
MDPNKIRRLRVWASHVRLRTGTNSSAMHASATPVAPFAAADHGTRSGRFIALVGAVVVTISVAICAVSLLIVTVAGTLHVGGSLAAVGVIAQLKLTAPVNPYHGVTETVDVFPEIAPGATLIGAPVTI